MATTEIYDEEKALVDVSKGLWVSPAPDNIPVGYCQEVKNMILNERQEWEVRKGFNEVTYIADGTGVGDIYPTNRYNPVSTRPHIVEYESSEISFADLTPEREKPQFLMSYRKGDLSATVIRHQTGMPLFATSTEVQVNASSVKLDGGLTSYTVNGTTRYYAMSSATVYRLTGFDYDASPATITATSIQALTNFYTSAPYINLTTYENRLFVVCEDKVYYTEVALTGGYPEDWNSSNNFFFLPSESDGRPTCYKMLAYNNLLYFFTDEGVYVLNGRGDADSWSVDFLDSSIKIYSPNSVNIVGGIFVITDRSALYLFNGNTLNELGFEIKHLFSVYNSFSIFPFEKGFILSCRYFERAYNATLNEWYWGISELPQADNNNFPKSRWFYFDGSVWTEFTIQSAVTDVIYAGKGKLKGNYNKTDVSYIIVRDHTNLKYRLMYYDTRLDNDVVDTSTTKYIQASLKTRDIKLNNFGWSTCRRILASIFSIKDSCTFKVRKNGATTSTDTTIAMTDVADNNYNVFFAGPELNTRFSVEVIPDLTDLTFLNTDYPVTTSIFNLKGLKLVLDSQYIIQDEQLDV